MSATIDSPESNDCYSVAVIGMAGRFPDARSVEEFWSNLRNGVESIRDFTDEELIAAGVPPGILKEKGFVRRGPVVPEFDCFDADFFGFTPMDAQITDPQQRVFMEVAWEALEHSGYTPAEYAGAIGVFAGTGTSNYLLQNILGNAKLADSVSEMQILIGNDKDFICTRTAYHLGLRGPAITVQTACSTSLVAMHLACQSLLNGESEMALAGGAYLPRSRGYLYQPGGNLSHDGRCRTFDAQASGTTPGAGVALVVLKSLTRALQDGDTIHAVIRGSAINNDASDKVGFTAPSVNRQAAVIAEALAMADVDPESIRYVEAHGTGTMLGDPIEMKALQQAFASDKKQFCAIGSLKSNVGHLDAAAGVAGLIKSVLTVREREIVPSLHFSRPNPHVDFANSPFYVNTSLQRVPVSTIPLRVGVSSFGIGGTNAHAIVEEPPRAASEPSARPFHVLVVSAKTHDALGAVGDRLWKFLAEHPDPNLADVAYTLQLGRSTFAYRRAIVCSSKEDAVRQLASVARAPVARAEGGSVVFMFPGQGTQYVGMAGSLYRAEEVFRTEVDRCAALLRDEIGYDLRSVLFADDPQADDRLRPTQVAQLTLFTVEYALTRQLEHWGVRPDAMIGHSLGEYVAACIAGVFSLQDALSLVARRGQLMASLPAGRMLAIHASEQTLAPLLNHGVWLAAVNAPAMCTVSGTTEGIEALEAVLLERGLACQRLHTSHAFHSGMMNPILDDFEATVSRLRMSAPRIRFISNVSGTWITAEQATSPAYWREHLRLPVRFSDGLSSSLQLASPLFVEVGPGRSLVSIAKQQSVATTIRAITSLPDAKATDSSAAMVLRALGALWTHGVRVDWARLHAGERRRRIPLPTYPFARQRHWIDHAPSARPMPTEMQRRGDVETWLHAPTWKRSLVGSRVQVTERGRGAQVHFVLLDAHAWTQPLIDGLRSQGEQVIVVTRGRQFAVSEGHIEIDATDPTHYDRLLSVVLQQHGAPKITHGWGLTLPKDERGVDPYDVFLSVRSLARSIASASFEGELSVSIVSNGLFAVLGDELLIPAKATILGPCKLLALEHSGVATRCIDIVVTNDGIDPQLAALLVDELVTPPHEPVVALRGKHRWTQVVEALPKQQKPQSAAPGTRPHYLITGGLGGVGYAFARHLAEQPTKPALTLIGLHALPPEANWSEYLRTHAAGDDSGRRIQQLRALETLGATVRYVAVNVADEEGMQQMTGEAVAAFGSLRGIFHAAGHAAFLPLRLGDEGTIRKVLAPKISGAMILRKLFEFSRLDFVFLCSSLNNLLPIVGQADAAAADAFLDALAEAECARGMSNVVSIDWAFWRDVGMLTNAELPASLTQAAGLTALISNGISQAESGTVFDCLLSLRVPQLIVSPLAHADVAQYVAQFNAWGAQTDQAQMTAVGSLAPRPDLAVAYVAPENNVQRTLLDIWQSLFRIAPIGINDDFFDLGGHSLMATQVLAHVRKQLQVTLPLRSLFEATTVADLALRIDAARAEEENARRETLAVAKAAVQKSIEGMSPTEIAALLAEKKRQRAASKSPVS